MRYVLIVFLLSCSLFSKIADASEITHSSEQIKAMTVEIAGELRCPMATNQTLFDSQAAIANELKAEIYLQLEQGKSKTEIIDFMVSRYGEKIRYMPSLNSGTMALYLIPLLLFIAIFAWVIWLSNSQRNVTQNLRDD